MAKVRLYAAAHAEHIRSRVGISAGKAAVSVSTRQLSGLVVARLEAHQWPSVAEFVALVGEGGFDAAEAAQLARRYADAVGSIPSPASHEDKLMAALRAFALP